MCLQLHLCDFFRRRYVISDLPALCLVLIFKKAECSLRNLLEVNDHKCLNQMVKLTLKSGKKLSYKLKEQHLPLEYSCCSSFKIVTSQLFDKRPKKISCKEIDTHGNQLLFKEIYQIIETVVCLFQLTIL